jgi:hypothetical protein
MPEGADVIRGRVCHPGFCAISGRPLASVLVRLNFVFLERFAIHEAIN